MSWVSPSLVSMLPSESYLFYNRLHGDFLFIAEATPYTNNKNWLRYNTWYSFCTPIFNMLIKRCAIFILFVLFPLVVAAQQPRMAIDSMNTAIRDFRDSVRQDIRDYRDSIREVRRHAYDSIPHEIRIGWGDQMFETFMWRNQGYITVMPPTYQATYNEHFRYTQHWFVEYLYNVNYWYSFGAQIDYSGVIWDEVTRNGEGLEIQREKNHSFHNISILPTVRFSYFHREYTSLYSSIGVGININTGTELDYKSRQTAVAPAVNIALLGLRVGKGRFYGLIEIGGLFSLVTSDEVYMLGSRIFTTSFGVRL